MRHEFELTLRQAEGALARVIGTAERRGFRPVSFNGHATANGDHWRMRLAVEGERPAESLRAQLEKLYDCLAVEVSPCRQ
ncbi:MULTISPECIES: ACT domain-containing protein [unclassified Lysobacter]